MWAPRRGQRHFVSKMLDATGVLQLVDLHGMLQELGSFQIMHTPAILSGFLLGKITPHSIPLLQQLCAQSVRIGAHSHDGDGASCGWSES